MAKQVGLNTTNNKRLIQQALKSDKGTQKVMTASTTRAKPQARKR